MKRTILGSLAFAAWWLVMAAALPAHAQVSSAIPPSARFLPPIQSGPLLPNGTGWKTSFEIHNQMSNYGEMLPRLIYPTQLIYVPVPPDFDECGDYNIDTRCTYHNISDIARAENLTGQDFGYFDGKTYMVPFLLVEHPQLHNGEPVPLGWGNGTYLSIFATSVVTHWYYAWISAFDGGWDPDTGDVWQGSSGEEDGWSAVDNPGWSHNTTNCMVKTVFLGQPFVRVYFAPQMRSDYYDWPAGVRCTLEGRSLTGKQHTPGSGGHGTLWPWSHDVEWRLLRFTVNYRRP